MTDEELMLHTQRDDDAAFYELYARWKKPVFRYVKFFIASPDEAEDILQEAFLSIYRNRDRYTVQAKFSTYLFSVVRSKCIDYLRSKKQEETIDSYDEVRAMKSEFNIDRVLAKDIHRDFIEYLSSLPEVQRSALYLRDVEQLSYDEIAVVLSLPLGTVKSHIHRGRESAYSHIRQRYDEV
jgi:RNA polymerase sigma-70 factor, ECF subfamily